MFDFLDTFLFSIQILFIYSMFDTEQMKQIVKKKIILMTIIRKFNNYDTAMKNIHGKSVAAIRIVCSLQSAEERDKIEK